MQKQDLYYRGTIVVVSFKRSRPKETRTYILAESFENDTVFQLVCISGYKAGAVYGFIKKDEIATMLNYVAVTKQHLIDELKRNLGDYYKTTLKIYQSFKFQDKVPALQGIVHKRKRYTRKKD